LPTDGRVAAGFSHHDLQSTRPLIDISLDWNEQNIIVAR